MWSSRVVGVHVLQFRVTVKGATPSCRQASDLSTLPRVPKLDQVAPPLLLLQYRVAASLPTEPLVKVPTTILRGLSGSTAMLGSEFWPVSALAAFGMTSMTGIKKALAGALADSSATADTAHAQASDIGRLSDTRRSRILFLP